MVPVVLAPVALAFKVWPEPNVKAVVGADTLSPAPLATVMFGVLASVPPLLNARVPALMVVAPW